jgi:hypothetical protein
MKVVSVCLLVVAALLLGSSPAVTAAGELLLVQLLYRLHNL